MFIQNIIDTLIDFWIEKKRYLMGIILFLVFSLVLVFGTGSYSLPQKAGGGDTESEADIFSGFVLQENFQQDAVEAVNALMENYFSAYASDDLDSLEGLVRPLSDNEKSYIDVFSQYIESYENISCYTKNGPAEGSYLVSVYYDLKFYEAETAAPGLDFFYLETDPDGELYVNNLYSSYNYGRQENAWDPDIYSIILQFEQQEDVIELRTEVGKRYDEAVADDVELAAMVTTTIPTVMADWLKSIPAEEENDTETEPEGTETPEETENSQSADEAEAEDQGTADDQPEPEEEPEEEKTVTVRTTDNVYIRASASKDSQAYEKALKGSTFTKIGTEGDWTQIEYNGKTAYMKSEYLEEVNE